MNELNKYTCECQFGFNGVLCQTGMFLLIMCKTSSSEQISHGDLWLITANEAWGKVMILHLCHSVHRGDRGTPH